MFSARLVTLHAANSLVDHCKAARYGTYEYLKTADFKIYAIVKASSISQNVE